MIISITKSLQKKINFYDAKITSLDAEIQLLKCNCNKQGENITEKKQKKLQQKVITLQHQAKKNNI